MKILVINNGFKIGGIELASCSFANYCFEVGFDVAILALYQSSHEVFVNKSIKIFEPSYNTENRYLNILRVIPYIRNTVKSIKPDVIVAHNEWTNGVVFAALYGMDIPIFLQDHMNPNANLPYIHLKLNKWAYPRATGVIALTDYAKQVMKAKYKLKNIISLPNPIRELQVKSGIEENRILSVGRTSREKGQKYLIEAFLKCNAPGWKLDIVGGGSEFDNLKAMSKGNSNIIFYGWQKDITPYLAKAKIFVLPSLTENYPLALIEAMSVGKACISTNCLAGDDVIIHNGINGLIVDKGNSEALAEAMIKMMQDEQLRKRLGTKAIEIKDELSKFRIYTQYIKFISQNL